MLEFQRTSEEIYRQNATALDGAHQSLAHPTDLKFGTLELIAARLLGKDKDEPISQEKISAVRKALSRGGFAFGHDRRSHRITGFIQIRSKEQVANVEKVRNWLRAWQDDLATFAAGESSSHQFSKYGQNVVNFIHKAKSLIDESRELREVTMAGRVGPSKKRFDISKEEVTRYDFTVEFDDYDRMVVLWPVPGSPSYRGSTPSHPTGDWHVRRTQTGSQNRLSLPAGDWRIDSP
jgi:hypothetical protein